VTEVSVCRPRNTWGVDPLSHPRPESQRQRTLWRQAEARGTTSARRSTITTLLLDMGGVVIPTLFESVAVRGFPSGPLSRDSEYAAVEQGEVTERDYWKWVMRERPDLDIGALWRECSEVRSELSDGLVAMAARYRMAVLTNDMAHWFGTDWIDGFPELIHFDVILEATRLGAGLKPDPSVFRAAAQSLGEAPSSCLFVDDLDVNLRGAAGVGMATMLFDVRSPRVSVSSLLAKLAIEISPRAPSGKAFAPAPRLFTGAP